MRKIRDWSIQAMWWISGIFATGAVWYFLSNQRYIWAVIATVLAVGTAGLAVWLHCKKDSYEEQAQPKPPLTIQVEEEKITFSELVRSLGYDIVKVQAHTHLLGVMAEYEWLDHEYPGCDVKAQALSTLDRIQGLKGVNIEKPIHFDVLSIELADERKKKIYFDISSFFTGKGTMLDPESPAAQKMIEIYGRAV